MSATTLPCQGAVASSAARCGRATRADWPRIAADWVAAGSPALSAQRRQRTGLAPPRRDTALRATSSPCLQPTVPGKVVPAAGETLHPVAAMMATASAIAANTPTLKRVHGAPPSLWASSSARTSQRSTAYTSSVCQEEVHQLRHQVRQLEESLRRRAEQFSQLAEEASLALASMKEREAALVNQVHVAQQQKA